MIPVKLTIQGLYSYQEKQTIDFTRLTSAHLFGIFGTVGSGKSSILEAITFALYGKTDRLNLSGDNRNYNMMNLKSSELLIDFEFETGKNQTAYRAVVKGKRNGKKFEEVKTLERTAYRNDNGNWISIEPDSLEKAIGLSYDNFKRTIIIPQGQFQEFLQLGNKDRTQMMKELFNLEKFELYYKVASLESRNNAQKQNLEGQLQQIGAIDPEQIESFESQAANLITEIESLDKERITLQQQETQWKQLLELSAKLAAQQQSLEKLKSEAPKFAELEAKLSRYEQCHIRFKSLLDALKVCNQKIEQKNTQVEAESNRLKSTEASILQQENRFAEIKNGYDNREQLRQKAAELDLIIRIQILKKQALTDKNRLTKGEEVQLQNNDRIEKQRLEKEQLEQAIKAEKAQLPDLTVLSKVKAWYVENKINLQQLNELITAEEKLRKEQESLLQAFQTLLKQPVFEGNETITGISQASQNLKDKTESDKRTIAAIDAEAEHLRVQLKLETYAGGLHENEPCPLCGSLHHPAIFSAASVAGTLTKLTHDKQKLEQGIALMADIAGQLNDLALRIKLNNNQLLEQQNRIKSAQTKIAGHQSQFLWPGYQQEETVAKAFDLAEKLQDSLKNKEKALDDFSKQLEKLQADKERFQSEIEKIKSGLVAAETELRTIEQQLRFPELEVFSLKTPGEIEPAKQLLLQQYRDIEKQFNELSDQLAELRKNKDTLSGSLQSNRKELELEQTNRARLLGEIAQKLEESGFAEQSEVEHILAQTIDLEREKASVTNFGQQLALAQSKTTQLQLEMGNKTYDREAHQTVLAQVEQANQQLAQKNQELGKTRELLKKLKKDLESRAQLQKEYDKLELRAENIRTMKNLFKASGFVNYISSVYLQNLCNAANDRFFQLTRQKLSLEITVDNNFEVRDFLNGGKVRSVKTLSGGQTFQAALCLALALADNIQKITESNQNFFFLDEGFGSLDKDSLAVVFDTLKALRRENRVVGVISHVEEMQQEIDTHLRIVNHEENGSLIVTSWG